MNKITFGGVTTAAVSSHGSPDEDEVERLICMSARDGEYTAGMLGHVDEGSLCPDLRRSFATNCSCWGYGAVQKRIWDMH